MKISGCLLFVLILLATLLGAERDAVSRYMLAHAGKGPFRLEARFEAMPAAMIESRRRDERCEREAAAADAEYAARRDLITEQYQTGLGKLYQRYGYDCSGWPECQHAFRDLWLARQAAIDAAWDRRGLRMQLARAERELPADPN